MASPVPSPGRPVHWIRTLIGHAPEAKGLEVVGRREPDGRETEFVSSDRGHERWTIREHLRLVHVAAAFENADDSPIDCVHS